jgi:ATP-dependent helicase IRC3
MAKQVQQSAIKLVTSQLRDLTLNTVTTPEITLRYYQKDALDAVLQALELGIRRPAVVLATGGGKTVLFSHMIPKLPSTSPTRWKTLVLAHKEELVNQAAKTIKQMNPTIDVAIDMRTSKPGPESNVIVASVPTLIRMTRLERYDPSEFKTIILDECHHATANSWLKILKYFDADHAELVINVIGFTATMERSDGKPLGAVFDKIVYERSLLEMVKNGELVDVKFSTVDVNVNLSQVQLRSGDYAIGKLGDAMNHIEINTRIAVSYIQLKKKFNFKTTLIFCVNLDHCKTLCAVLQDQGINAQYVTGLTSKHERQSIIEDFKNGKIDVLCNVQVFTEGTDVPSIDSIFLARPTKSRLLLVQMIGRGLRLNEGKCICHVVDIAETSGTGIQSVPTLFGFPADHFIDGKTFVDLEKERKNLELEKDERLKKEKEIGRQILEKETTQVVRQVDANADSVRFSFNTIDGFLAMQDQNYHEYGDMKTIRDLVNESAIPWVRLRYGTWGYPKGDYFYLLELTEHKSIYKFFLTYNRFTTINQKIASGFACTNFLQLTNFGESYELEPLLKKVEIQDGNKYFFRNKITEKQISYISLKLRAKTRRLYGDGYQTMLEEKLLLFDQRQTSNLIFAIKFSIKSLHVRWQLLQLLGPDKKLTSELRNNVVKITPK